MNKIITHLKDIEKNYKFGIESYNQEFKSDHWRYINKKKTSLYEVKKLKNFRNNDLSFGLDDQFYSNKQFENFFLDLIKECGEKYVLKFLSKKNIGNVRNFKIYKKHFVDRHEIFFIKYLKDLESNINLKKVKWVCEIGSGYGGFLSKLLKFKNFKVVAIDLPESHFLTGFFLRKHFPKKKIYYSFQSKNKKIEKKDLSKYDIFLLYPWDLFPNIKIDLFVNTRSMMEMDYKTINNYFNLIHKKSKTGSYFYNINRYYKDTTGYPIEFHRYPYDGKWKVIFSRSSWKQNHTHCLLTKRINIFSDDVKCEMKVIKKKMYKEIKKDSRFIRRSMPDFLYKIYKSIKRLVK